MDTVNVQLSKWVDEFVFTNPRQISELRKHLKMTVTLLMRMCGYFVPSSRYSLQTIWDVGNAGAWSRHEVTPILCTVLLGETPIFYPVVTQFPRWHVLRPQTLLSTCTIQSGFPGHRFPKDPLKNLGSGGNHDATVSGGLPGAPLSSYFFYFI